METSENRPRTLTPTVPPYEEWPSVPHGGPLKNPSCGEKPLPDGTNKDKNYATHIPAKKDARALSMDDIEAAQALENLRADVMSSQQTRSPDPLRVKVPSTLADPHSESIPPQRPEPLLSLLTSQHPLLSSAIHGSLSAYTTSKAYSPSFRYGAELVERIGSPLISTVETAGRISGVEDKVRGWLQKADGVDMDRRSKRRRIEGTGTAEDMEKGWRDSFRSGPIQPRFSDLPCDEGLPAYDADAEQAPTYEEDQMIPNRKIPRSGQSFDLPVRRASDKNFMSKLMIESSALGVSRSDESFSRLKYCLMALRTSMRQIANLLQTLTVAVKEWISSQPEESTPRLWVPDSPNQSSATPRPSGIILREIHALKDKVGAIMSRLIEVISSYTGGALPENARDLVRRHLISLPRRFQAAFASKFPSSDAGGVQDPDMKIIRSAQKTMIFGKEALGVMDQIEAVLQETMSSAERWYDKLGRNARSGGDTIQRDQMASLLPSHFEPVSADGTHPMAAESERPGKQIKSESQEGANTSISAVLSSYPEMAKAERLPGEIASDTPILSSETIESGFQPVIKAEMRTGESPNS